MAAKVLIVEDEAVLSMLMEQTLEGFEKQGITILTAYNGEEGLKMIQAEKPGLVFLDVTMPKMNGYEVCRAVKRDPQLAEVFVVLLTGNGQEFDRVRGEQAGANIYMTKPFDPDELIKITDRVLAR